MKKDKNTVARVSAPDTTEGTKRRNAEIAAEAAAREKAEIEYYRSMVDPNNQSAEAMAFRDGPIQSLTPDVIEMIALGKPTEWAMKAASPYVKAGVKEAARGVAAGAGVVAEKTIPPKLANWAAKEMGKLRPMFVRGGRGLNPSEYGVRDGLYIGRDAAIRLARPDDIKALKLYNDMTGKIPFAKMSRDQQLEVVRATGGWQELPTGEVVRQIPKMEFNSTFWKNYEQFATPVRRKLSSIGRADIETATGEKAADGTIRGAYMKDAFQGPGADELFAYYPEARDYVIRIGKNGNPKLMGEATADEFLVTDAAFSRGVKQVVDTVHHEPMHLVQDESRMAAGGNLSAYRNVMLGMAGKTDATGKSFISLPRADARSASEVAAFRENLMKMHDAVLAADKKIVPGTGRNELEKLANANHSAAEHFMYRHLGGEAGSHAIGSTSSAARGEVAPELISDAMRSVDIDPSLVYDFRPGIVIAQKTKWLNSQREEVESMFKAMNLHQDAKGGEAADVRAATKGGDGGGETQVEAPVQRTAAPVSDGGPRIAVNPAVFHDKRDALCVALNEAFRVIMEMNGFEPVAEPTPAQRRFFADTAYANDEVQLRRTILARICTFDTSVADPTDEQLQEAVEFLETVMEIGAPQNEWEQSIVQRIHDILMKAIESSGSNSSTKQPERPVDDEAGIQADVGGGESSEDDKNKRLEEGNNKVDSVQEAEQPAAPQDMSIYEAAGITVSGSRGNIFTDSSGRRISQREADKLAKNAAPQPAAPQPAAPQPAAPQDMSIYEVAGITVSGSRGNIFTDSLGRRISQREADKLAKKAEERILWEIN